MLKKLLPKAIGFYINTISIFSREKAGALALDIFATPRNGKIRASQLPFLNQFEKSTIIAGKLEVAVYKKGSGGTSILLCHGWESNASRWKKLVSYLEQLGNYTFIMMDAPAHGNTNGRYFSSLEYGACIAAVCKQYSPDVVIGHSIGAGSIVYCHAEVMPLNVSKVVLLASPNKFEAIMNDYKNLLSLSRRSVAALANTIEQRYNYKIDDYHIAKYAQSLKIPTLVIHDKDDRVTQYQFSEAVHKNLANAQLLLTEGLGHGLQDVKVYKAIQEFIAS